MVAKILIKYWLSFFFFAPCVVDVVLELVLAETNMNKNRFRRFSRWICRISMRENVAVQLLCHVRSTDHGHGGEIMREFTEVYTLSFVTV